MSQLRVLRVFHAGRSAAQRRRERALVAAGVDLTLLVPASWAAAGSEGGELGEEAFDVRELAVRRSGDVVRHVYADAGAVARLVSEVAPDVVDIHEEPFSSVTRQLLRLLDPAVPVLTYSAQNLDKRWPPPFHHWERTAFERLQGIYPCSRQVASVLRGKGFTGPLPVIPLGTDLELFRAGTQRHDDAEWQLCLLGRMEEYKGVLDAVQVLAAVQRERPARLLLVGDGPAIGPAKALAAELGVGDRLTHVAWCSQEQLASRLRATHVVLVPSRATRTWTEQFGRVIVEGQASGAVVLGYDSGSISEVVGPAGLVVPESDLAALCFAAVAMARSGATWAELREQGPAAVERTRWSTVAAAQVALYEQALARRRYPLRPDRPAAQAQFGPPARILGQERPFALPLLREDTVLSRGLGRVLDGVAAGRSRAR